MDLEDAQKAVACPGGKKPDPKFAKRTVSRDDLYKVAESLSITASCMASNNYEGEAQAKAIYEDNSWEHWQNPVSVMTDDVARWDFMKLASAAFQSVEISIPYRPLIGPNSIGTRFQDAMSCKNDNYLINPGMIFCWVNPETGKMYRYNEF